MCFLLLSTVYTDYLLDNYTQINAEDLAKCTTNHSSKLRFVTVIKAAI